MKGILKASEVDNFPGFVNTIRNDFWKPIHVAICNPQKLLVTALAACEVLLNQ
jgi:hypothetical protein